MDGYKSDKRDSFRGWSELGLEACGYKMKNTKRISHILRKSIADAMERYFLVKKPSVDAVDGKGVRVVYARGKARTRAKQRSMKTRDRQTV